MFSINHDTQQSQQQNTNHEFKNNLKPSYRQSNKTGKSRLQSQQSVNNIHTNQNQIQHSSSSLNLNLKSIIIFILNKILVIFIYFMFSDYKLLDFIFVILVASIDFWMCKNIHGKSLVGLRWWVQLDQHTQQDQWIFQSINTNQQAHNINYGIFWSINLLIVVFWIINFIICIFLDNSTFWISLCLYCLTLGSINIVCFYKCHGNHHKKAQQLMEKIGLRSATNLLSRSQQMVDNPHIVDRQKHNFSIQ